MEILLGFSLYFTLLVLASTKNFRPLGWALAWAYLAALSGFFRIFVALTPSLAPAMGRGVLMASALAAGMYLWRGQKASALWRSFSWLPVVVAGFIIFRNFFPQFDVDSLNYHLTSVLWFLQHSQLTPLQQHQEVFSLWSYWLGFEEFLLVPGHGAGAQLAVWGGVVGGVFKTLTVLSVFSTIPARLPALRALAAVALLIDDHFFFSGISGFVYISPAMIGQAGLAAWCVWRALRGHSQYFWAALALGMGIASVKYHGIYFLVAILGTLAVGQVLRFFCAGTGRALLPALPKCEARLLLAANAFCCAVMYLFRWVQTGTPTVPFKFASFAHHLLYRGTERADDFLFNGSAWQVLSHPKDAMMFPAIYANKAVMWLVLPALGVWLLYQFLPRQFGARRWLTRPLQMAMLGFVFTVAWALMAIYIRADETRYPRYVMAVATIAVAHWLLAFRRPALLALRGLAQRTSPRLETLLRSRCLGAALACVLLGVFFVRIDHRHNNVLPSGRAGYSNVLQFIGSYLREERRHPDPAAPYMGSVMMKLNHESVPQLQHCVAALATQRGDPSLLLGNKMIVFGPNSVWPSYLVAPLAIIGTISEGGGYLRLPAEQPSLMAQGIEYALIPANLKLQEEVKIRIGADLKRLEFASPPLCASAEMLLVQLTDAKTD